MSKDSNNVTLDGLARMVADGFSKTATKQDVDDIRSDIAEINIRLDKIEGVLYRALDNRIERLEDRIRVVETTLGKTG